MLARAVVAVVATNCACHAVQCTAMCVCACAPGNFAQCIGNVALHTREL